MFRPSFRLLLIINYQVVSQSVFTRLKMFIVTFSPAAVATQNIFMSLSSPQGRKLNLEKNKLSAQSLSAQSLSQQIDCKFWLRYGVLSWW